MGTNGSFALGLGGLTSVELSGEIKGNFYLKLCGKAQCDNITVTLEGCYDLGLEWKAQWRVLSMVVKEESGDESLKACAPLASKEFKVFLGKSKCGKSKLACAP
jgi:hypothetical protein